jgi:hypothetical protein
MSVTDHLLSSALPTVTDRVSRYEAYSSPQMESKTNCAAIPSRQRTPLWQMQHGRLVIFEDAGGGHGRATPSLLWVPRLW